jgi:hypothetical protein
MGSGMVEKRDRVSTSLHRLADRFERAFGIDT